MYLLAVAVVYGFVARRTLSTQGTMYNVHALKFKVFFKQPGNWKMETFYMQSLIFEVYI